MTNLATRLVYVVGGSKPDYWFKRYQEESKALGIDLQFLDVAKLSIVVENGGSTIYELDQKKSVPFGYLFLAELYEKLYYYLLLANPKARATNKLSLISHPGLSDKFTQSVLLSRIGGYTPDTTFSRNTTLLPNKHTFPLVMKVLGSSIESSSGIGVFKIESIEELKKETSRFQVGSVAVQDFIHQSEPRDYRSILVNGKLLNSVVRVANKGDFKTNSSQIQEPYQVSRELENHFSHLAHQLQLDLVAIDYAIIDGQPYIYELNRFPYFEKFEQVTHTNIAKAVLESLLNSKYSDS